MNKNLYYEQKAFWDIDYLFIPAEKERISKTIELIPSDIESILDVGCGNGAFLNSLSDNFKKTGLDMSEEALRHVKAPTVLGNSSELPFEERSYDLVTCLEVLEHLPQKDFLLTLNELTRVSKKYILISVPNDENLEYGLCICPKCKCHFNPNYHVRSFNKSSMMKLFDSFILGQLQEIGPVGLIPSYNNTVLAAYRTWKQGPLQTTAICPQCGYHSEADLNGKNLIMGHGKTGLISNAIRWSSSRISQIIWPPAKKAQWIIGLYERL